MFDYTSLVVDVFSGSCALYCALMLDVIDVPVAGMYFLINGCSFT